MAATRDPASWRELLIQPRDVAVFLVHGDVPLERVGRGVPRGEAESLDLGGGHEARLDPAKARAAHGSGSPGPPGAPGPGPSLSNTAHSPSVLTHRNPRASRSATAADVASRLM